MIKTLSNPARCQRCGRFIPDGYQVYTIGPGRIECLTHRHGTESIDKGAAPWSDNNDSKPSTRRTRCQELADA